MTNINEQAKTPYQVIEEDEIDLRELWNVIWQGKWTIVAVTFVFSLASVTYAVLQPNLYKAQVLLAPSSGESNQMGQMAGLAAMAGISLGGGGADKSQLALATIETRDFLTKFINRHELTIPVFAGEKWDRESGELLLDAEVYDSEHNQWLREVEAPKKQEPSDWEKFKKFSPMLSVSADKKSGLITLSIEYLSPILAKQWVDFLVKDINKQFQEQDYNKATKNIAYLTKKLEQTAITDMQNVFFSLIEEQMKNKMLAKLDDEYVFKIIDPAVIAEEKSKPKRALIAVVGTITGGMLGIFLVFILNFAKSEEKVL
ncbi:MAG: Wzz/FepE/Etk N-terminal domain-containing protein [Methyloprofundus sp.]|nr:Wzz/FepE/Etk N-terminal domain-containing protein [Methyloprofundus sp.]